MTLVATLAANTLSCDLTVPLSKRINARYVLRACNGTTCSDSAPVTVAGSLAAGIGYFKASNSGPNDSFGQSVALSSDGNTLAVGAPYEDGNATGVGGNQGNDAATDSGAVYIFTRSGTAWSQQAYVKPSLANGPDDWFGACVALSADGNTLAVGAPNDDRDQFGVDQGVELNRGAAYVFSRTGSGWAQQAYLKAANSQPGDLLGYSVALSSDGTTLAVGSPVESNSGGVYVFMRSGSSWSQQAHLRASNFGFGDMFGACVGLSADGNFLAVGAPSEDSNAIGIGGNQTDDSAFDSGAVYIFSRSGTAWSQQAYVKSSNTDSGDAFGSSLSLAADGATLAVGAPNEDSTTTGVGGNQSDNFASDSGAVYVYSRTGTSWSVHAYLKASNTGAGDLFGSTVAISSDGATLAVGARLEDGSLIGLEGNQADGAQNSGAVYVFVRSASWTQRAYVKAANTETLDAFGRSVALSADGNSLAVGAAGESSNATGIGGNQSDNSSAESGAVYLY